MSFLSFNYSLSKNKTKGVQHCLIIKCVVKLNIKTMAYIDSSCVKAIEFAKTLNPNIKIDNGINWIWAYGFTSKEDAEKFDNFCCNNNCETSGVYSGSTKGTYDVRFR